MASDENAAKPIVVPFEDGTVSAAKNTPQETVAVAVAASETMEEEPHATLVFLRHGQSVWNEASLFTGGLCHLHLGA